MISFSTTKMTSKGQIVIPEETRSRLGMKPGTQFMVIEGKDSLILKVIAPPSMDDFDELIEQARRQADKAGLKQTDITKAARRARNKN